MFLPQLQIFKNILGFLFGSVHMSRRISMSRKNGRNSCQIYYLCLTTIHVDCWCCASPNQDCGVGDSTINFLLLIQSKLCSCSHKANFCLVVNRPKQNLLYISCKLWATTGTKAASSLTRLQLFPSSLSFFPSLYVHKHFPPLSNQKGWKETNFSSLQIHLNPKSLKS